MLDEAQRALDARLDSDWLRGATGGTGAFPPMNVFQQGDNLIAILEVPGVDKADLEIQVKHRTIRVSGKKAIAYLEGISLHRRERLTGTFDRTLTVPMQIDAYGIKAEYRDGVLALFNERGQHGPQMYREFGLTRHHWQDDRTACHAQCRWKAARFSAT